MSLGLFLIYSKIGGLKMKRKGGDDPVPPVVDKTDLENAIDSANELVEADYTVASWGAVSSMLSAATIVANDDDATQQQVNTAEQNLVDAINNLVDISQLASLVGSVDDLEEGDYTPETWGPFASALLSAQNVLADPDATVNQVSTAYSDLDNASNNLEPSGG